MTDEVKGSVSDYASHPEAKFDMNEFPSLVSIAGIDDWTDIKDLKKISAEYSNIEWSVLLMNEKQGRPRNPTDDWIIHFLDQEFEHTSIHLCGEVVFRDMLDPDIGQFILAMINRFKRVQLNINARSRKFTTEEVHQLYDLVASEKCSAIPILQLHDDTYEDINSWLVKNQNKEVHVLVDSSRGKGVVPESWDFKKLSVDTPVSFAGGINPDNCLEIRKKVSQVVAGWENYPHWYGMDMESGVRTDDKLDPSKVMRVASQIAKRRYPRSW